MAYFRVLITNIIIIFWSEQLFNIHFDEKTIGGVYKAFYVLLREHSTHAQFLNSMNYIYY
jgi:hypothetical protein